MLTINLISHLRIDNFHEIGFDADLNILRYVNVTTNCRIFESDTENSKDAEDVSRLFPRSLNFDVRTQMRGSFQKVLRLAQSWQVGAHQNSRPRRVKA